MDETFAEALIHRRAPWLARKRGLSGHVVLGQRLRPYSYWHAFGLDVVASPIVGGGDPLSLAALAIAVSVCTSRYPWLDLKPRSIGKYAPRFGQELSAFTAYLADYNTGPVYGSGADSVPLKTPWYFYSVALLMRNKPRLTEAQAWDTPVSLGGWWNAVSAEASGHPIDIMTPELREAFALANQK